MVRASVRAMTRKNKPQAPVSLEQRRAWLIEHRHPAVDPFWPLNDGPPTRTLAGINRDLPEIIRKAKDEAAEKAVHGVARPGGNARGQQKSDAADKWRKPATEFAKEIWRRRCRASSLPPRIHAGLTAAPRHHEPKLRLKNMTQLSKYSSDYELPPEGLTHPAVLVRLVDEGVIQSKFGQSRQCLMTFELCAERTLEDQPVLAFKRVFNMSTRSKNMREIVRALSGLHDVAQVDLKDLIGKPCTLSIEHVTNDDGNVYADVEVKAVRGKAAPYKPVTESIFVSLHIDDFDEAEVAKLIDRQREKVMSSPTYKQVVEDLKFQEEAKGKTASDVIDDDFPESLGGAKRKKRAA
jgi:hypothetical protein